MKTPVQLLSRLKQALLPLTLMVCFASSAQVQWYQNQDGQNQFPQGTFASVIKGFTFNTFVACYQWQVSGDQYTWKISKSNLAGTELKALLITGTTASVEIKTNRNGTVYALKKDYPLGQNPVYTIYKLNSNLEIIKQADIVFSGDYYISSLNAFETDNDANIYVAGDGQNQEGSASFFARLDKNLVIKWTKMQEGFTSFTQIRTDRFGRVWLLEDFYTFFPDVYVRKYSSNGILLLKDTINTSPYRYDLFSKVDDDGNLYLYGNRGIADTAQGMFLYRLNRNNGSVTYSSTLLPSAGFQLYDLLIDGNNRMFTSSWRYLTDGSQEIDISRINAGNGQISWNKRLSYSQDSLLLYKLVDANDKVYGIGEKRSGGILSKGLSVSFRKTGQREADLAGPDSTSNSKSHLLMDGIATAAGNLVTIGNTLEMDMQTYNINYYRAFAVSLNRNNNCNDRSAIAAKGRITEEVTPVSTVATIYPNPATDYFIITGLNDGAYDRVTLHNMLGEQVYSKNTSSNALKVDASSLIAGTYIATLSSSSTLKQKTLKIIVNR